MEWLAAKEYIRPKSARASYAILPKEASGRLRAHLKDALATVVWGGWGATLRLGGGCNAREKVGRVFRNTKSGAGVPQHKE